ncbi:TIGR03773 family transporter-associated surface protein [Kribbella sp. NPDC020789]
MTATHSRPALPAAFLSLVLGALCLLVPWTAGASPAPEVLRAVHTDALHTTYDGSALKLATRIGTGTYREADPAGLIFNLEDRGSARVELPDLPAFAFLGTPGSSVWIAPESQDPELIWPGWDTETIPTGALRDDAVQLTLLNVDGPGAVEVFSNYDEFAGKVPRIFSSVDPAYKTLRQPVGRHVHANWSFAALGTYHLTFQASALTAAGTTVTSGPVTYTWAIGPYEAPTPTPTTPPTTSPTSPPTTPTPSPPSTPTPPRTSPTPTPTSRPTIPRTSPTPGPTAPTNSPTPGPTAPSSSPTPGPTVPGSSPTPPPTSRPTRLPTAPPTFPAEHSGTAPTTAPGNSTPKPCITTPAPPPTQNPTQIAPPQSTPTQAPTTTAPPTATTTLSNGHADYAVRLEGGTLRARIKDGTNPGTPVWRDPSTVTIRLNSAAGTTSPGGAFEFLGPKGTPVWQIPQTQKDGVIWLGWNTEELKPGQVPGNTVTWRLDKVTGPGRVAVFEFNSFGQPQLIFNTADGLPDTYQIPIGTHAHGNWTFTRPGTYNLTFTHSTPTAHTTSTLRVVVAPGGARSLDLEHPSTTSARENWSNGAQSAAERLVGAQSARGRVLVTAGSGCGLAATGAEVQVGWFVAAGLFVLLGAGLLVVSKRGDK